MKLTADMKLIGGAVVVAGLALWWIARKDNAASIGVSLGGAAVDLAAGTALGVVKGINDALGVPTTSQVIAAANDPNVNPLQPFGAWLGGKVYDWTHPSAVGGP